MLPKALIDVCNGHGLYQFFGYMICIRFISQRAAYMRLRTQSCTVEQEISSAHTSSITGYDTL